MKKKLWLTPLFLAGALLQGCAPMLVGAGAAAGVTAFEDRRTSGTQIEDEGIELRASNRINDRYRDKLHINFTSYNRWLLMTGEVPDEKTRDDIEKLALSVPNVRGVANELQVAGVTSLGSRTNDSFITSKVKARFVDGRRFNPVHVKVVTEAGVVYLLGMVTEKESEDAVAIARTTDGVRKVVKIFETCKATDELCRSRPKPPAESAQAKPGA
jgi:osmotically-inducible protein OsmY